MCAHVFVRMCGCVCMCGVCMYMYVCVRVCVCACVRAYYSTKSELWTIIAFVCYHYEFYELL